MRLPVACRAERYIAVMLDDARRGSQWLSQVCARSAMTVGVVQQRRWRSRATAVGTRDSRTLSEQGRSVPLQFRARLCPCVRRGRRDQSALSTLWLCNSVTA